MLRLALLALILPLALVSSGCKTEAGKTLEVKITGSLPLHAVVNTSNNFFASINDKAGTTDLLSFRWDIISAPGGLATVNPSAGQVLVNQAGVETAMTFTAPGTYQIRITVFQTSGTISDSDDATVIVTSSTNG